MSTLSELKNNRNQTLEALKKEAEKAVSKKKFETDPRFWKPTPDKAGNAVAVFRFLPGPKIDGTNALPWVRLYEYGFQGIPGRFYIEKSLQTLSQPDPAAELVRQLWAEGNEEKARKYGRREQFIANILMVNDTAVQENNGKVFLYKFGKKIFENKILPLMHPEKNLGVKEIDPFNFWDGCNFMLKMKKVGDKNTQFPNYDESMFIQSTPISDDDAIINKIWESEYSLLEFLDPKTFKTYGELKKRLEWVLGGENVSSQGPMKDIDPDDDVQEEVVEMSSDVGEFDRLLEGLKIGI